MDKLKKERQDLNDENHDGFARHKETLEKEMMERQNKAERTKALRLNYIKFIYDAECKQIQDEFEVGLRGRFHSLRSELHVFHM